MDKFFNIIGKISSVLFFIVLLGIVGVISWSIFGGKKSPGRGQVGVVRMEEGKEKKILALYEIQWVIKFQFPTQEINHMDKILYFPIAACSSFGELDFRINAF